MNVRLTANASGYHVEVDGHLYDADTAEAAAERMLACVRAVRAKHQAEAALTLPLRVAAYLHRTDRASTAVIAAGLRVSAALVEPVLLAMVAAGTAEPLPAHDDAIVYRLRRHVAAAAS